MPGPTAAVPRCRVGPPIFAYNLRLGCRSLPWSKGACNEAQVRGSIPILWSQSPNLKYKIPIRIAAPGKADHAFATHIRSLVENYKVRGQLPAGGVWLGKCLATAPWEAAWRALPLRHRFDTFLTYCFSAAFVTMLTTRLPKCNFVSQEGQIMQ
jgi:hypothetical protein